MKKVQYFHSVTKIALYFYLNWVHARFSVPYSFNDVVKNEFGQDDPKSIFKADSMNMIHTGVFLLMILLQSACTYQYVDTKGARHIIGFADVTISQAQTCGMPQKIEVATLGLSSISLPSHGGVTLGYAKNTTIIVENGQWVSSADNSTTEGKEK